MWEIARVYNHHLFLQQKLRPRMVGEGGCPRSHSELGTELELESGPIRSPVAPCLSPASGLTPSGRFTCSQATCADLHESSSVPTCLAVCFHNGLGNSEARGFLHRDWPTEGTSKCWRKVGGGREDRRGEMGEPQGKAGGRHCKGSPETACHQGGVRKDPLLATFEREVV